MDISPPRDRAGRFEPQLVGKWTRQLGTGLDQQILTMYTHGNSYGDIQHYLLHDTGGRLARKHPKSTRQLIVESYFFIRPKLFDALF